MALAPSSLAIAGTSVLAIVVSAAGPSRGLSSGVSPVIGTPLPLVASSSVAAPILPPSVAGTSG